MHIRSGVVREGHTHSRRAENSSNSSGRPLISVGSTLQRAFGNADMQRLVQAKLKVGQPNDNYEREADKVAAQVMQMPEAPCACGTCSSCQEKKEPRVQLKTSSSYGSSPDAAGDDFLSELGYGRSMDCATRSFFESRLGRGFEHVRIHTGAVAEQLTESLGARAFAYSNNIVFGPGEYSPYSVQGKQLLGHELVHTIQQQGAAQPETIMRQPSQNAANPCAGQPTNKTIDQVIVNQESPQRVTVVWSDNSPRESDECSSGKGHCCAEPPSASAVAAAGAACSKRGSRVGGSNCTPVGTFRVTSKIEKTAGGVELWTQFHDRRSIALHRYSRVDGTPLSHGCVRLHEPMAKKIFCGARGGGGRNATEVEVQGLARPLCNNRNLQAEWLGDFRLAGTDPPDGETIDPRTQQRMLPGVRRRLTRSITRRRAQLRSALGVTDRDLTSVISTLNPGARTDPITNAALARITPQIPRCVPLRTSEEARLGSAAATSLPARIVSAGGGSGEYDRLVADFETALARARSLNRARELLNRFGLRLWRTATRNSQTARHPDQDDRPLYWSRLRMTSAVRDWAEEHAPGNPDQARRSLLDMLAHFELVSRGMTTAGFSGPRSRKRILISGFDPFGLSRSAARSNASGAAVLALDGKSVTNGNVAADIQGVIFPVRFRDFDEGMVESFFGPFLSGSRPPDMIMTISMGGSAEFEVEQFAGRRRSFRRFRSPTRGNLGSTGGVTRTGRTRFVEPPGLAPGPEFLETALPVSEMLGSQRSTDAAVVFDPSRQFGPGRIARTGSGGGFLSNEIFYRTRLLVAGAAQNRRSIPVGHLHTPILAPPSSGISSRQFEDARDRIVDQVSWIIRATLPAL